MDERANRAEDGKWLPGKSGNPSGRPKMPLSLTKILKELLETEPEEAEAIVKAHIKQGKYGDMRAITELYDRIDGKVLERHKIETEPITLTFVPAKELKEGDNVQRQGITEGSSQEGSTEA